MEGDMWRTLLDAIIFVYLLITIGGLITTVTHESPVPRLAAFTEFSYGMLAPYQGDDDQNREPVVVGTDASGTTTLVPVDLYFAGRHGERNARQRLQIFLFENERMREQALIPFLIQILEHEHRKGNPYVRLDWYEDQWTRSPQRYDANRMSATHMFITSVR